MNILEARRRVLGGEVYKKTAEGNPISVRSLARMRPGLSVMGRSTQKTTTGAQLFDVSAQVDGYIDGTYGILFNSKVSVSSDYVAVMPLTEYSLSYSATERVTDRSIAFYDADKAFLSSTLYSTNVVADVNKQFETPDGCYYIRFTVLKSGTNVMLNEGSTAKPWEPYTGGKPSPSPDYPQEITSAGDNGSIEVSVSDGAGQNQFLTVQTPNGLPGIPVNSGGNYTDENGQQWICDEIDFKRGKYVQRIHVVNAKNRSWDDAWNLVFPDETGKTHVFDVPTEEYAVSQQHAMSNVFFNRDITNSANVNVFTTRQGNGGIGVRVYSQLASTLEEWNAYINSHDVIFVLALKKQGYVETPLSPSELAAYAALRTYSPTTVVSNDAGAWMKLGYKTKKSLEVT